MIGASVPFRDGQEAAWTYHRATCYSQLNKRAQAGLSDTPPRPSEEYEGARYFPLPPCDRPERSLTSLLEHRSSCRQFSRAALQLRQLGALAWATYGNTGVHALGALDLATRTIPSAGGLYPLELWFVISRVEGLAPGIYHYQPVLHGIELVAEAEFLDHLLARVFMGQTYAGDAAVVAVLAAVPARSLDKYGDRGYRYLLLEAGHAMQNLNITANAIGLGSCNLGGFYDDELATLCRMDTEKQFPLYACAVGVSETDADDLRIPRTEKHD
jgi:SagB-type dehydrogenase family enzyme